MIHMPRHSIQPKEGSVASGRNRWEMLVGLGSSGPGWSSWRLPVLNLGSGHTEVRDALGPECHEAELGADPLTRSGFLWGVGRLSARSRALPKT